MERAYDAIVVGSGFGGGIAACRLAEQGLRVCVLERGRRFGPGDYPDRLAQFPHALWHARHNPGGMFDVRIMKDVAVVTGAGVGGGSLVYANVQLRAPDEIFDDPAWPAAIDAAELDRFYARTEKALDRRSPRARRRRSRRSLRSRRWPARPGARRLRSRSPCTSPGGEQDVAGYRPSGVAQQQNDGDDIVERSDDREELGQQVDRRQHPEGGDEQRHLRAARDRRVTAESACGRHAGGRNSVTSRSSPGGRRLAKRIMISQDPIHRAAATIAIWRSALIDREWCSASGRWRWR